MEDTERVFGEEVLLKMFSRDIDRIPLLSREEETALATKARAGCEESANSLVEANLRFVMKVVFRYWRPDLPLMDLVSEGCLGLMKAVKSFNPDMGYRLLTYAEPAIRHNILVELGNYRKHNHVSLDDCVYEDGDEVTRKDLLVSEERGADTLCFNGQIAALLNRLSDREQKVLKMRIWEEKLLEEVAAVLNLSVERTRHIEARALRKLRWSIYEDQGGFNGISEAYALSPGGRG